MYHFPAPMRVIPSCAASNLLSDDESSATSANTINQVLASNTEPDRARVQFTGGSYSGGNATSRLLLTMIPFRGKR